MNSIKQNKSFQVIVGAFVCYLAWRLYTANWFSWMLGNDDSEGFSNADLILSVGSMVVDFLQLVGLAAIGIVSGVLPELQKITGWINVQLRSIKARYKLGADKDDPAFDWRPLIVIVVVYFVVSSGRLNTILDRIKSVVLPDTRTTSVEKAVFYLGADATEDQKMIANSTVVADLLEKSGVERRVYYSDQDLGSAEDWVQKLVQSNQLDGTSLILESSTGIDKIAVMPSNLDFYRSMVSQ